MFPQCSLEPTSSGAPDNTPPAGTGSTSCFWLPEDSRLACHPVWEEIGVLPEADRDQSTALLGSTLNSEGPTESGSGENGSSD